MGAILKTLYCVPCLWLAVWSVVALGGVSYIRNSWVPYRGPLPSDGPLDGFDDKQARIDYFDTSPLRIRYATLFATIVAGVAFVGDIVIIIILTGSK
jgi:hypothetical protein